MKKTGKVLCSSLLTIAVSASLICSSTLALFTSESKTNIAITSGKVDVEAEASITKAWSAKWEDTKYTDSEVTKSGDTYTFTNGGTASYAEGTLTLSKFTPGDGVEFKITATNNSTIAIKYQTVVTFVSGGETTPEGEISDSNDSALFRALEISVGDEEGMKNVSSDRSTAVSGWSDTVTAGGDIEPITVTIQFPVEGENHDELQDKSCKIAIGLYAVQSNGHDTTNSNVYFVTKDSNLGEVFDEAQSGDTVVLADDLTMPEEGLKIEGNKEVNVDLSGNTFGVNKESATSEDLVITEGSSLTVKDSVAGEDSKFTVETKANSSNAPSDREHSDYTTEGKKYTMKVEGTLNFEDVDVEVNNKQGDVGICVDGGTVNFDENTELSINGREANDGYGEVGFGKGFYVTNGGTVNLDKATVESEGAVTSFIVGGGEDKDHGGTLNITGGTYTFNNMYNSITHATFVSAFQTYENGKLNIEGANLSLTGKAVNQLAYDRKEQDTGYTNMVLISTIGGGDVDVKKSEITLAPELGTAFVAQTVCSYYYDGAEPTDESCTHTNHRGMHCNAHVTFSDGTKIYLNSAGHQTNSEACYVFAASRNGDQIAGYKDSGTTYYDETVNKDGTTVAAHEAKLAEDPYSIKVGKDVEIYFSEVGADVDIENPKYHKVNDLKTGEDDSGNTHEHYYLYDLKNEKGGQPYFEYFINRYNPEGVQFLEEEPQP